MFQSDRLINKSCVNLWLFFFYAEVWRTFYKQIIYKQSIDVRSGFKDARQSVESNFFLFPKGFV